MYFKISFALIINLAIVINRVRFMVFNTTFNNISVISWRPVLFGEQPVYPEKTIDLSQVTDTIASSTLRFELGSYSQL
jgi:hypothetical protein